MHRDVLELKASCGDHVVVYMRSGVDKHLMQGLLSTNRECHIYGTGERGKRHNLSFMPPSRSGFLEDLSSCAYVICNGGYALTGEALQLGKPVLAFPTAFFMSSVLMLTTSNCWVMVIMDKPYKTVCQLLDNSRKFCLSMWVIWRTSICSGMKLLHKNLFHTWDHTDSFGWDV